MTAHTPLPPWIARQRDALLAQRGHAWLLHGPSGLGQYTLALELVRAWLCDAATAQGACGQCPSCHGMDVHTHADFCILMPEVQLLERDWPLPAKAQIELDEKKRKPSREIRVDALREAVEFTQRTSARGHAKAIVVYPAERMNAISANTLLKTLEEPPGDVRFVLATEAAHALLPTIRSRCLAHTMHWPKEEEILAWLGAQDVAEPEARIFLHATGGRPDDALAWARSGRSASAWAQFPHAVARGELSVMADMTPAQTIHMLQKLCHDLLAQCVGAAPRYFAAADLPPAPALGPLTRWAKQLAKEARSAEHPFHVPLMQEALFTQARQVLYSRP